MTTFVEDVCAALAAADAAAVRAQEQAGAAPAALIQAFRDHGVLAPPAAVPAPQLVEAVSRAAETSGSFGLVYAMHLALVGLLDHLGADAPAVAGLLEEVRRDQVLVAGSTSDAASGGDLLANDPAAVEDGHIVGCKRAVHASYLERAGLVVLSVGLGPEGRAALVVATRDQVELAPRRAWSALGMRGTESASTDVRFRIPPDQRAAAELGGPVAARMVALTHTFWAACWRGLARSAVATARGAVRAALVDPARADLTRSRQLALAAVVGQLDMLDALVERAGARLPGAGDPDLSRTAGSSYDLRVRASDLAVGIVLGCLDVIGVEGYLEDSPGSVVPELRDVLSSRVMTSLDRSRLAAAAWSVVTKETGSC